MVFVNLARILSVVLLYYIHERTILMWNCSHNSVVHASECIVIIVFAPSFGGVVFPRSSRT